MNLYLDLDFKAAFAKDRFIFGVANAPYLCEGGYNTLEGPKNNFGYFEAEGSVPVSGETTRFWTDYRSHIQLAARLGLTAFRTGVDWSRVQPTRQLVEADAPEWDDAALERYADIISCVQESAMEAIITLHHFTHPAWLGPTLWLRDDAVEQAVAYELRVVSELGDRLASRGQAPAGHFITFNELNLLPLIDFGRLMGFAGGEEGPECFQQAYDNVLSAHVRIYDGIKELYEERGWAEPRVGFGSNSDSTYEFDKLMLDVVRLREWGVAREDIASTLDERRDAWDVRIAGLGRRQLNDEQYEHYIAARKTKRKYVKPEGLRKTLDALYASSRPRKIDFISANVYEPFGESRALGGREAGPRMWEWAADGDIYRTMIHAYNEGNVDLPMYMGENGFAYEQPRAGRAVPRPDGWSRERYLKTYLMEMVRCIAEGVPIKGYLYWSLVDDFEWDKGFSPRFGLYNYDYVSHEIGVRDGLGEPAGEIYSALITTLQGGDKSRIREAFVNSYEPAK